MATADQTLLVDSFYVITHLKTIRNVKKKTCIKVAIYCSSVPERNYYEGKSGEEGGGEGGEEEGKGSPV